MTLPWREREFVSIADAAAIAGRSRTWVENQHVAGYLDVRRLPSGGPMVVTVASLRKLLDAAEPHRIIPFTDRPRLRLVASNPGKKDT